MIMNKKVLDFTPTHFGFKMKGVLVLLTLLILVAMVDAVQLQRRAPITKSGSGLRKSQSHTEGLFGMHIQSAHIDEKYLAEEGCDSPHGQHSPSLRLAGHTGPYGNWGTPERRPPGSGSTSIGIHREFVEMDDGHEDTNTNPNGNGNVPMP